MYCKPPHSRRVCAPWWRVARRLLRRPRRRRHLRPRPHREVRVGAMRILRPHVELLSLPQMVLRSSDRGGKKNKARNNSEVRERCQAWLEGQRKNLWKQNRNQNPSRKKGTHNDLDRETRAAAWGKEGLLRKTCSALISDGPAEVSPEVVTVMGIRHPRARERKMKNSPGCGQ